MTQLLKTGREACDKCHNLYIPLPGGKPCTCPSKPVVKKPVSRAVLEAEHKAMYEALKDADEIICSMCKRLNPSHKNCTTCSTREDLLAVLALVDGRE